MGRLVGGLDLGQRVDHTVLVTAEVVGPNITVQEVVQLPLGISFAEQLALLALDRRGLDVLAVDSSGIGQSVAEQIVTRLGGTVVQVVTTSGSIPPRYRRRRVSVSKEWLVRKLLDLAGSGRLAINPNAPGRDLLRRELASFELHPTAEGQRLEASKGEHDDSVMALGLATLAALQTHHEEIWRS